MTVYVQRKVKTLTTSNTDHYDEWYREMVDRATVPDISSEEATVAMKNLKTFSECRPPAPEPEPTPEPTTFAGKLMATVRGAWDNETTRVLIKTTGPLAGVGLVVWSTVHRDHVIEREALSQANQRPQ